eukprot:TRINITY_DN6750_c0_g1_i1.p1 TRINITY_DN6750_c0_g1~~TRINITY_DN6750_c0_g1_i1.p1  ORF type:complete len:908 (+),score=333.92 TRINITY_DN6750_c0_g1_i1:116-2725(+)
MMKTTPSASARRRSTSWTQPPRLGSTRSAATPPRALSRQETNMSESSPSIIARIDSAPRAAPSDRQLVRRRSSSQPHHDDSLDSIGSPCSAIGPSMSWTSTRSGFQIFKAPKPLEASKEDTVTTWLMFRVRKNPRTRVNATAQPCLLTREFCALHQNKSPHKTAGIICAPHHLRDVGAGLVARIDLRQKAHPSEVRWYKLQPGQYDPTGEEEQLGRSQLIPGDDLPLRAAVSVFESELCIQVTDVTLQWQAADAAARAAQLHEESLRRAHSEDAASVHRRRAEIGARGGSPVPRDFSPPPLTPPPRESLEESAAFQFRQAELADWEQRLREREEQLEQRKQELQRSEDEFNRRRTTEYELRCANSTSRLTAASDGGTSSGCTEYCKSQRQQLREQVALWMGRHRQAELKARQGREAATDMESTVLELQGQLQAERTASQRAQQGQADAQQAAVRAAALSAGLQHDLQGEKHKLFLSEETAARRLLATSEATLCEDLAFYHARGVLRASSEQVSREVAACAQYRKQAEEAAQRAASVEAQQGGACRESALLEQMADKDRQLRLQAQQMADLQTQLRLAKDELQTARATKQLAELSGEVAAAAEVSAMKERAEAAEHAAEELQRRVLEQADAFDPARLDTKTLQEEADAVAEREAMQLGQSSPPSEGDMAECGRMSFGDSGGRSTAYRALRPECEQGAPQPTPESECETQPAIHAEPARPVLTAARPEPLAAPEEILQQCSSPTEQSPGRTTPPQADPPVESPASEPRSIEGGRQRSTSPQHERDAVDKGSEVELPKAVVPGNTCYSAAELRACSCRRELLAMGVDPWQVHEHLSAAEFQLIFKMNYQTFRTLPGWKQDNRCMQAGLRQFA